MGEPHAIAGGDVRDAARRIASHVLETPLLWLDALQLWVKCESFQRTGSFKIRGVTNALLTLRPRGVVAASSGNHGVALATAARKLGIPAVVVMSEDTSPHKQKAVSGAGGEVVVVGLGSTVRNSAAERLAVELEFELIPPYDHPLVIAGQGTVGLEIGAQLPAVTSVVVPVGGGGLIGGIAVALRTGRGPVVVIGAEPAAADDTARSLAAGHRVVDLEVADTVCDGARAQAPGALTFPIVRDLVARILTAPDATTLAAMRLLAQAGLIVEPTAALSVAVALEHGLHGAVCVLSGRNISLLEHARLLADPAVAPAAARLAASRGA